MTARRPPPLAASLFAGGGPLAPGSAKAAISPSRLHPKAIVDAHFVGDAAAAPRATANGAKQDAGVRVIPGSDGSPTALQLTAPPLVLGQDAAQYAAASSSPFIPLVVDPRTHALQSHAEWDALERTVEALSSGRNLAAAMEGASLEEPAGEEKATPVIVAGLLLPLLSAHTSPRQIVQTAQFAELWQPRLASLSLNKDVYLQLLPPMVDTAGAPGSSSDPAAAWWKRQHELDECVRIYLAHALECFGAHRILFGSGPATAHDTSTALPDTWQPLVEPEAWYALARGCLADLVKGDTAEGVDSPQNAMDDVFGAVARRVYGLE